MLDPFFLPTSAVSLLELLFRDLLREGKAKKRRDSVGVMSAFAPLSGKSHCSGLID